ncbi:MAG: DUF1565 domain-containing protein [Ruminococcaceae bacterium]|nr:DUF1565 domain-containing protein [Oscillospiraceae bacterium]
MKRTFALAMSVATLLTSFSASAAELQEKVETTDVIPVESSSVYYSDVENSLYKNEIIEIADLGVITGYPDKTYRPYSQISRAELAVLMSRFLSVDHYIKAAKAAASFSDVSATHWAAREIKYFADEEVFAGYGDGTFRPEEFVTYDQMLKILVAAMGYGDDAENKGGFPLGYRMSAAELGITKGITDSEKQQLNRGVAAKLLYNALDAVMANGDVPKDLFSEDLFYVSTAGSDTNPGTKEKPWKTMKKAAQAVIPGGTVIFEDGVYDETSVTTFTYSGTKEKPITLKARNKHGATIKYGKTMSDIMKMQVTDGLEYINIRDFHFTQQVKSSTSTQDIYIRFVGSSHCEVTGNKFTNMFEEAIKTYNAHHILIADNVIIEPNHEGMDIFASSFVTIRGNELDDCGRVGLMLKGNANNCLVYNNYIHNEKATMMSSAIGLGGSSDNYSPFDVAKGTGYENYYTICYNNIIVAGKEGLMPSGIGFISSKGCQAWNNVLVGCDAGFLVTETDALRKGWEWDPPVVEPVMRNNIVVNCKEGVWCANVPSGPDFENNLFCNVNTKFDVYGFEGDAKFLDNYSDWHLLPGSDAIDRGTPMPEKVIGYNGQVIDIDLVDYDGNPRTGKWDLGIYNVD